MLISKTMDLTQLAERMGDDATDGQAGAMRERLMQLGFDGVDTADVPKAQWDDALKYGVFLGIGYSAADFGK